MTSKLQVTVPKALADRYGIRPGDHVRFEEAGEVIRVLPAGAGAPVEGFDTDARPAARARSRATRAPRRRARLDARGALRAWPTGC